MTRSTLGVLTCLFIVIAVAKATSHFCPINFQPTLAAVWCLATLTAEQRLLHPVVKQGMHFTGKMLFCISNLLEPSQVSLQPVCGTEPCCVTPHGKTMWIINKENWKQAHIGFRFLILRPLSSQGKIAGLFWAVCKINLRVCIQVKKIHKSVMGWV